MDETDDRAIPADEFGDYVRKRLREQLDDGEEIRVSYSCYDYSDEYCLNNLDEVAVEGPTRFVVENDYTGDETFRSGVIESPTYLDAAVQANRMILQFGYRDHVFLEGIRVKRTLPDGLKIATFFMGS